MVALAEPRTALPLSILLDRARATAKRFAPDLACKPAVYKAYFDHDCRKAGVSGDYTGATGYMMCPVDGSLLAFIDCDDPQWMKETLLPAIPRLKAGYVQLRGLNAAFGVRLAYPLPNASLTWKDDNGEKHERASLRGPGLGQMGSGSPHYREVSKDVWEPSGDFYRGNGQAPITLPTAETDALARLFNVADPQPPQPAAAQPIISWINDSPDDDYQSAEYITCHLDPDLPYRDWIRVNFALCDKFGEAVGGRLFDGYSERGSLYKRGEPLRKAKTNRPNGSASGRKVNFAWLCKLADEQIPGWREALALQHGGNQKRERKLDNLSKGATRTATDKSQNSQDLASELQSTLAETYRPPMIGAILKILHSDDPDDALSIVLCTDVSRATAYRRKCLNSRSCIGSRSPANFETSVSERQIRDNYIRILFDQSDFATALIPMLNLSPDHFDGHFDEDEIDDIADLPEIASLTKRQQREVTKKRRTLENITGLASELDHVPFMQEMPVANRSELKGQILRAIIKHLTKTDPTTGEIKPPILPNHWQACLINVTVGALGYIRDRDGVSQPPKPMIEKRITSAQNIPSNARKVKTVNEHGEQLDYRLIGSNMREFAEQKIRLGQIVMVEVQPPAEPIVGPLPERQPRKVADRPSSDNPKIAAQPREDLTCQVLKPRRTPRQTYAAELMTNILRHLHVTAAKTEPLEALAGKLRARMYSHDKIEDRAVIPLAAQMDGIPPTEPDRPLRENEYRDEAGFIHTTDLIEATKGAVWCTPREKVAEPLTWKTQEDG